MADYKSVLGRAIAGLQENSPEARRGIYDRARAALERQLNSLGADLGGDQARAQFSALESAIQQIEGSYGAPPQSAAPPPPPPQPPAPEAPPAYQPPPAPNYAPPPAQPPAYVQPPLQAQPPATPPLPPQEPAAPPLPPQQPAAPAFPPTENYELTSNSNQRLQQNAARLDRAVREFGVRPDLAPNRDYDPNAAAAAPTPAPAYPDPYGAQPGYPQPQEPRLSAQPGYAPQEFQQEAPAAPPEPPKESGGEGLGRGATIGIVLALLLLIGGAVVYDNREALLALSGGEEQGEDASAETETADAKIEDRVPGSDTAEPVETAPQVRNVTPGAEDSAAEPAPEPAPEATPAAVEGETAFLYEEAAAADGSDLRLPGGIAWSIQPDPENPDIPAIQGNVSVPDRTMTVLLLIRINRDETLPASHTVELLFSLGDNAEFGEVANIGSLAFKENEPDAGTPLIGASAGAVGGAFFIVLSDLDQDRTVNETAITTGNWIDIPVLYSTGKRAILTLNKGDQGGQVFSEVMERWGTL